MLQIYNSFEAWKNIKNTNICIKQNIESSFNILNELKRKNKENKNKEMEEKELKMKEL